jgi:hypothetical protein
MRCPLPCSFCFLAVHLSLWQQTGWRQGAMPVGELAVDLDLFDGPYLKLQLCMFLLFHGGSFFAVGNSNTESSPRVWPGTRRTQTTQAYATAPSPRRAGVMCCGGTDEVDGNDTGLPKYQSRSRKLLIDTLSLIVLRTTCPAAMENIAIVAPWPREENEPSFRGMDMGWVLAGLGLDGSRIKLIKNI